jgi:hypothetical protein
MAGGQESLPEAAARGRRPPNGPKVLIENLDLLLLLLFALLFVGPLVDAEDEEVVEGFEDEFCC